MLVAGEANGVKAPVPVHSPLFYLHADLAAGERLELPSYPERAVYVASGLLEIGGQRIEPANMAVLAPGPAEVKALAPSTVIAIGGEPVGERYIEWNFVSSSRERIRQAKEDWRAGRMKLPVGDDRESIPLPPDAAAPANPMS